MRSAVLLLVAGACVCAVSGAMLGDPKAVEVPQEVLDRVTALQRSPELSRMVTKGRQFTSGGSFFQTLGANIMNYLGFGSDDDYEDYNEADYFYPSFDPQTLLGGPGSSYSFYNPYGNQHPARDDNFEEEDEYSWGDFMFDAAVVAVPMALVLAAMPTGLFTIPIVGRSLPNNVEETLRPFELPVLRAVEKADFLSYTTRDCQERIFCEITQIGRHKDSSLLQKAMYLTASLTPDAFAKSYSLDKLFKAARDGHCDLYKCVPLMSPAKKVSSKQRKENKEKARE